jgi:hypothetical protein
MQLPAVLPGIEMSLPDAQWFLTEEEYADIPAFKSTTWESELESRYQAASLIQKIGVKLNL